MRAKTKKAINGIYDRLFRAFGPQEWWPAQTRFEVIVGAILTQNTNWANVERAISQLKRHDLMTPKAIRSVSLQKLAKLIRSSGYFNMKAKRVKNFVSFLYREYAGDLKKANSEDTEILRQKLLMVNGIGPETADSILLYAFNKPVFVVDAYTKRVLARHNIIAPREDYHKVQQVFTFSLRPDPRPFNEYHALIVKLGKEYCRPHPDCDRCPLKDYLYSLTNRCSRCYRALPKISERVRMSRQIICTDCHRVS